MVVIGIENLCGSSNHHLQALMNTARQVPMMRASRDRRNGRFERANITSIEPVAEHLTAANRPHLHLPKPKAWEAILESVIDQIPGGIIVVDPQCKVLMMNRAAELAVAKGDVLAIRHSHLIAVEHGDTSNLWRQVAAAATIITSASRLVSSAHTVVIRSLSSPRPLILTIAPVAARFGVLCTALAIFFARTYENSAALAHQLVATFGLTSAEARIAAALASGLNIEDIAKLNEVSKNTVRNQLQSVFAKTETSRQAELVALIREIASFAFLA